MDEVSLMIVCLMYWVNCLAAPPSKNSVDTDFKKLTDHQTIIQSKEEKKAVFFITMWI